MDVCESAVIKEGDSQHCRMDVLWTYLTTLKHPDGSTVFNKLPKVALLVLTLPHSNAEEERVFSMVSKNKTKFRGSLQMDGSLSSILTLKCADIEPCHQFDPPRNVLETAKRATMVIQLIGNNLTSSLY